MGTNKHIKLMRCRIKHSQCGITLRFDSGSPGNGDYLFSVSGAVISTGGVSSDGVCISMTGLTKHSYSESSAFSSPWALTKSFSHSRALESSEAEAVPLVVCFLPGRSAARSMSSSVLDLSHAVTVRFIPEDKDNVIHRNMELNLTWSFNWWFLRVEFDNCCRCSIKLHSVSSTSSGNVVQIHGMPPTKHPKGDNK